MSTKSSHPLEDEFLEAIQFLRDAIDSAKSAASVAGAVGGVGGAEIYNHTKRPFGFVWVPGSGQSFGPPGAEVTHLAYPWDDPTGWTVARSGE